MKFGIIGTGAVGGYYGSLLARSGRDVHFLLHSDYDHVKDNGLAVESKDGDFRLPSVNAYSAPENMPECDVTVIALKTTMNTGLSAVLPHVMKKDGIVITLQNGLGIEDDISGIMPHATVIGGLCFLCSSKVGPGHIRHLDFGAVKFGEHGPQGRPAGITSCLETVAGAFEDAGVMVHVAEDLIKARWEKLVWNMGFSGVCAVLNATTDQLMACESSAAMIRGIMGEVIAAANQCGYSIENDFADTMIETTRAMASYSPSMKLDVEMGRPLETEAMYWRPIRAAEAAGYSMNMSRTIAMELDFIEHKALPQ